MEERIRQEFIEILKRLLSDLHNKKYEGIDYILSADQELTDFVLQLDFVYTNKSPKGIRCVFGDIDYR